jgi:hypothetical protein
VISPEAAIFTAELKLDQVGRSLRRRVGFSGRELNIANRPRRKFEMDAENEEGTPRPHRPAKHPARFVERACLLDDATEQRAADSHLKTVRVGRTPVGKGVFARRRYACEAVIGEIRGEVIHGYDYGSDYCMDIGDGNVLEPAPPFRFLNHCCEPNCEFDFFQLPGPGTPDKQVRVFLLAIRDIMPGEELTIDYHWSAASAIPCRCHAPNCRGWIVDACQLGDIAKR